MKQKVFGLKYLERTENKHGSSPAKKEIVVATLQKNVTTYYSEHISDVADFLRDSTSSL